MIFITIHDEISQRISLLVAERPENLCKLVLENSEKAEKVFITIIDEKGKENKWFVSRKT